MSPWRTCCSLLLAMLSAVSTAYGSGFAVFTQGASALGQGNAVTAHADDPSAMFYNPALINKLDGTQVQAGTTLMLQHKEFTDTSGTSYDTSKPINFPSTFYATYKFNDKLSAGLGVFSPFGLKTTWGNSWPGSTTMTSKSDLKSFNINPAVSYQIIPGLSFAAGVDILLADVTLENKSVKFEGKDTAYGYNFGILADLGKDISIGSSYRSEIKVEADGNTYGLFYGPAKINMTLPQQVTAGVAYRGFGPLTLEAGIRWEGWSSFEKLQYSGTPLPVSQRNWKDVFAYNFGGKYRLNDTVSLLAGYLYGNSPVPDSTFDATIPDATTHVFSVGTDLDYKKFRIAIAYAYQYLESRHKNNAVGDPTPTSVPADDFLAANGKYQSDVHMLALSLVYKF